MTTRPYRAASVIVAASLALSVPGPAGALPPGGGRPTVQEPVDTVVADRGEAPGSSSVIPLAGIAVTATREERDLFLTPAPVAVLGSKLLERRAGEDVLEAFVELPGLDREGVGGNQARPVIRGLGGQRVLVLKDGLRLGSPRRRVDSGEPPALAGRANLERVEIVRGPASVLYGSDAIGGVVNLVTREAPLHPDAPLAGSITTTWGSGDNDVRMSGGVAGGAGPIGTRVFGGYRSRKAYRAPAGTFGDVRLDAEAPVTGTGIAEHEGGAEVTLRIADEQRLTLEGEAYRARDAGYGRLALDPGGEAASTVDITFPDQLFRRESLRYRATGLGLPWADRAELAVYAQGNRRDFETRVWSPFGGTAPAGAGVEVLSRNHTRLETLGVRVELARLLGGRHLLTYGLEVYRDRSSGWDTSTVTVQRPDQLSERRTGNSPVPDATLRSLGVFAQGRATVSTRTEAFLGARFQSVASEPLADTDGQPSRVEDHTLVGALGVLHRMTRALVLVASLARGFRSPNLVERYFTGTTPEAGGVWIRNPGLRAETSLEMDLGLRWRTDRLTGELFLFRNRIADGILLEPTGDSLDGRPTYQNVNVGSLRLYGIEAYADLALPRGFALSTGLSWLGCSEAEESMGSVSEACGGRATSALRWAGPDSPFWAEYVIRWTGARTGVLDEDGPVGPSIPSFLVQHLRAGARLGARYRVTVTVRNLGDALFAETADAAFFRPEPGRRVVLGLSATF